MENAQDECHEYREIEKTRATSVIYGIRLVYFLSKRLMFSICVFYNYCGLMKLFYSVDRYI